MPRYFFNVYNAEVTLDDEGVVLLDDASALQAGREAAAALISEQIVGGRLINPNHYVEILDEQGQSVLVLPFGGFFISSDAKETAQPDPGGDRDR